MQKKIISSTGLEVSEIGLGCMGMSEFYGPTDDTESLKVINAALEYGITHFDTADNYAFGENEKLLGKAIKHCRDKVVIATKFGILRDPKNPSFRGLNASPEYVKYSCDYSLEKLGIDTIDLLYLHRIDPATPIEITIEAMAQLVKEGKVRYLGLSEANADTIKRAHSVHPISAVQTEYSLWSRSPEKEIIPLCKELGIGFVSYSPLGRGFLTGKLNNIDSLSDTDFRRTLPRFQKENIQHNLKIIEVLQSFANIKNCTVAQIALAWLLAQGDNITAIPGTRRLEYLSENVQSLNVKLDASEIEQLNTSAPMGFAQGSRYSPAAMTVYGFEE
ncbi:MAG: aldo/keto reductase [Neisseriaceae bacterium]